MKKIVFFKIDSFSAVNVSLLREMRRGFPDTEIQVIDVLNDILQYRIGLRFSLFCRTWRHYGEQILGNRLNPRDFFFRFEDAWDTVREWNLQHADVENTLFTFQTQSLFDASHPKIPHFLYTDHTYLANRRYAHRPRSLPVTARWNECEHALYHHASVNFTTSEFAANSIIEDYKVPADRVQCVYSGINISIPAEVRTAPGSHRRILFAGMEWERKGGPLLLEAFATVRRLVPDAELWIVGCRPAVQQPGVRILGRVHRRDMLNFYMQADVFCLPSMHEPSAVVLTEAAMYGLPVVATAVGGSTERVAEGKTGFLVPPHNAAALAEALLKILRQPELAASFSQNGQRMAREKFTWERVGEKIRDRILKEVPEAPHKKSFGSLETEKRIYFFKIGSFSLVNRNLLQALIAELPEFQWCTVDVLEDIIERNTLLRARLLIKTRRYFRRILQNRQNPRDFFSRFPEAWQAVSAWAADRVSASDTAFTFQTQSLFDARVNAVPHFVLTDHTYFANRRYALRTEPPVSVSDQWLELEQNLYAAAHMNFTTNHYAERSLIEDYHIPRSRVECIFSGINAELPGPITRDPETDPVILFAGYEWERKGGPTMLRAFEELLAHCPNARLWIVGCRPSVQNDRIRTFGRVSMAELQQFYREASIFCLPGLQDPSASVLIEAAAYSLPVVTTDTGGSSDRVRHGETGFLVPPGDWRRLAEALIPLCKDPDLRRKTGEAGRKFIEEEFTWKRVAKRIATTIRSVCGSAIPPAQ